MTGGIDSLRQHNPTDDRLQTPPAKAPDTAVLPALAASSSASASTKVFDEQGHSVVRLTSGSSSVEILPATSATVRSFEVGGDNTLVYPEGQYTFTRGIPAPFFIWGGRIVGGKFMWMDDVKDLTPYIDDVQIRKDADGNGLHGLQFPWETQTTATIANVAAGSEGAAAILTYDASQNRIFRKAFDQGDKKASAKLGLVYTLNGDELSTDYSIKNDGEVPIPNYTNSHPWWNTDGNPVSVSLPATERIQYKNHVRVGQEPATGQYDFRNGPRTLEGGYEEVFKVEGDASGKATSTLILSDGTKIETVQNVSEFPYVKVWINPALKVASIQPLSDNIGSFTQTAEPTCDIIKPGEERHWRVKMKVTRPKTKET